MIILDHGTEHEYQDLDITATEPTYSNTQNNCIILSRDKLTVIRELGSGQYGRVFLAEVLIPVAYGVEVKKVAVKTTKGKAPYFKLRNLEISMSCAIFCIDCR